MMSQKPHLILVEDALSPLEGTWTRDALYLQATEIIRRLGWQEVKLEQFINWLSDHCFIDHLKAFFSKEDLFEVLVLSFWLKQYPRKGPQYYKQERMSRECSQD